MEVFGPTDAWPEHQKPWFKKVYKKARGHGWNFEKYDDHGGGRLFCPRPPAEGDPCEYPVYSTGKGSEDAAKEAAKLIERCRHTPAVTEPLTLAGELLDQAERLLNAAAALFGRDHNLARADELMESEEYDDGEITELLAEVDRLEREVQDLLALEHGEATDTALLQRGSNALDEAAQTLRPLPRRNTEVAAHLARLKQLRGRRDKLRTLLGTS